MPWHRYTAHSRRFTWWERVRCALRILRGERIKFSVTVYTETETIMIDDGRIYIEEQSS